MRRPREIPVELTSLLDVILIMLFVLLLQARTQTEKAHAEAAESAVEAARIEERLERAETERAEAERERDALSRRILTDHLVLENSRILTISVRNDGSIQAEIEDGMSSVIEYEWADDSGARSRLLAFGEGFLQSAGGKTAFLIFQYDRNRIYHAEYEMIASVIQLMREEAKADGIAFSTIEADLSEPETAGN